MRYFLGLDVAKDSFVAVLLDAAGQLVGTATFSNDTTGFNALLAWLPAPAQTIAVCEPTGVYNQRLKQALATSFESLHEINSQTLKQYAFSQVRTKTDQADALAIADAARTLFLSKPETLAKTRVSWSPQRENLALWLAEYDRLRKVIATLRQQIGDLDHHAAADAAVVQRRRRQELKRMLAQQKQVKQQIERAFATLDDAQAKLIDSIPGLGPISTAATLVVVRNVARFRSADALKAYLGIYPAESIRQTRTPLAPGASRQRLNASCALECRQSGRHRQARVQPLPPTARTADGQRTHLQLRHRRRQPQARTSHLRRAKILNSLPIPSRIPLTRSGQSLR
jgi:transposase